MDRPKEATLLTPVVLGEIAEEPSLDDVLNRLAALLRRDLGVSAAELVSDARSE